MQEFIENYLKYFFIGAAVLAALSSFARPDFNLPLYIFIYLMWDNGVSARRLMAVLKATDYHAHGRNACGGRVLGLLLGAHLAQRRDR